MKSRPNSKGFTFIELAVVLVIIGLLASGIMFGALLIEEAEVQKTTRQIESFRTAFYTFKTKYNATPGDMPNPSRFWSEITTEGNGNGLIDQWPAESVLAWRELSLAQLINVNIVPATPQYISSVTAREAAVAYWNNTDVSEVLLSRTGNNIAVSTVASAGEAGVVFTAVAARKMDQKLDDGHPERGKLWGLGPVTGGLSDDTCAGGDGYAIAINGPLACRIIWFIE